MKNSKFPHRSLKFCVVAAVLVALACVLEISIYKIVLFFDGCLFSVLLLWAISCALSTCFIDLHEPCVKRSTVFRWYANTIIYLLKSVCFVRLHVSGMDQLPDEQFLLVGNHRSSLDPILEMGVFGKRHMGFVAKQELFKIPVIGKIMHQCFCLSLDRGDVRDGLKTIKHAAGLIENQTASIGIYPEGTRNHKEGLLPFKDGAFKIAQKAKCPIVVVLIRNSDHVMKRAPFRKTDVFIDVIGVIHKEKVCKMRSRQLSEMVREMMEEKLNEPALTA